MEALAELAACEEDSAAVMGGWGAEVAMVAALEAQAAMVAAAEEEVEVGRPRKSQSTTPHAMMAGRRCSQHAPASTTHRAAPPRDASSTDRDGERRLLSAGDTRLQAQLCSD